MAKTLKLFLGGASGRMGGAVAALAQNDARFSVIGGLSRDKNSSRWVTLAQAPRALKSADIIVDFSLPGPAMALLRLAGKAKIPVVTGTTGFSGRQYREIASLAKKTAILASPNMSPGMNLLFALTRIASLAVPAYDASVMEIHHKQKKDAPSGSALALLKALRRNRIAAASLRMGTVVGEHTVHLAGPDERIELTHRAQQRTVFARGALEAAAWLKGRKARGLYSMTDVLGL